MMRRFLLEQCGTKLKDFMPSRQEILRNRAMRKRAEVEEKLGVHFLDTGAIEEGPR